MMFPKAVGPRVIVGGLMIAAIVILAVFAPWISSSDPLRIHLENRLTPPSFAHPFGTDTFGRDVLSRTLWGGRVSLTVALCTAVLSAIVGSIFGIISGYFGGSCDTVIGMITDILLSFPKLILAVSLVAVTGLGLVNVIFAIGLSTIPMFIRVVKSATLSTKEHQYVEAAVAIGLSPFRIMLRHILPHVLAIITTYTTINLGAAIITESTLSFLGLGIQPPTPSWGFDIFVSRTAIREAPWSSAFPGLFIMITVLGFNFLGDGIRDLLDPALRDVLKIE